MAIQDDMMAMLSQVSDAGDRATSREALGRKLYAEAGDRLSGDALYNALRDVESARGSMGEIEDYSRVADILEKYMDDAGDGVPAPVPDDMIVDDTRAAMEVMPSPDTAPRTPVGIEELPAAAPRQAYARESLPEVARPDFDPETAERLILERDEGLAGLMAGQMAPLRASDIEPMAQYRPGQANAMRVMRDMSQSPSTRRPEGMTEAQNEAFTRMMKSQLANEVFPRTGMTPEDTYDLFMSGDGEAERRMVDRMSGPSGREYTERRGRLVEGDRENQALALGSAFIPMTAIPKLAAQAGISAGVVNRLINSGPAGIKRLTSMIRSKLAPIPNKTPGARMRQRVDVSRQPNPNNGFNDAMNETTRRFTATGGAASGGQVNNIRDKIMNTYGRM